MFYFRLLLFFVTSAPGFYILYTGTITPIYQYYFSSKSWVTDTAFIEHFDGNNLEIRYYFVDKKDTIYDNNIFFGSSNTSDQRYTDKFFQQFENTKAVIVYKNPKNPHENVLIREIASIGASITMVLFSAMWVIGCYLFTLGGLNVKRKTYQRIVNNIIVLKKSAP